MYNATANKLTKVANHIFSWLCDSGFTIDPDKCEAMFFHPRTTQGNLYGSPPANITLQLPDNLPIIIKPSTSLWYLGVFFTPHLNWMAHVKIMSTHTQSLVKGLGILGNSIRGFHLLNWQKIFISVILPILTYGCQVWFYDISQITLIQTLQVTQNEACQKLASIFHTTPVTMTHSLLSIPPICFHLQSLLQSQGHHLASQPPSCLLQNPHLTRKVTLIPSHVPTTPLLPAIADTPPMNPIFTFPNHPATPPWSHPHATLHQRSKNTTPAHNALKNLSNTTIFLSSTPFHIPKVYLHIFAIYDHNTLIIYDYCTTSSPTYSLLLATTSLLRRLGDHPERQEITIFYSDAGLSTLSSDNRIITRNVTHTYTFRNSLDTTLSNNPLCFLTGHWFSRRWANARTEEWFSLAVKATFQATLTATQITHKPLSECLLEEWRSSWTPPPPEDQH